MLNKYLCCSYQYNWYLCTCTVKIYILLWTFLIGLSELCIILPEIISVTLAFNKITSPVPVCILGGIYVPVFGLLSLFFSWGHHGRCKVVLYDHTLNNVLYYFSIWYHYYHHYYRIYRCIHAPLMQGLHGWLVTLANQSFIYSSHGLTTYSCVKFFPLNKLSPCQKLVNQMCCIYYL